MCAAPALPASNGFLAFPSTPHNVIHEELHRMRRWLHPTLVGSSYRTPSATINATHKVTRLLRALAFLLEALLCSEPLSRNGCLSKRYLVCTMGTTSGSSLY
jgi:hypothetical protein